jgi:hypothetical protein
MVCLVVLYRQSSVVSRQSQSSLRTERAPGLSRHCSPAPPQPPRPRPRPAAAIQSARLDQPDRRHPAQHSRRSEHISLYLSRRFRRRPTASASRPGTGHPGGGKFLNCLVGSADRPHRLPAQRPGRSASRPEPQPGRRRIRSTSADPTARTAALPLRISASADPTARAPRHDGVCTQLGRRTTEPSRHRTATPPDHPAARIAEPPSRIQPQEPPNRRIIEPACSPDPPNRQYVPLDSRRRAAG